MKRIFFSVLVCFLAFNNALAQCNQFCSGNFGLNSNDDAGTIAYDNVVSALYGTSVREGNDDWKAWGIFVNNSAQAATLPLAINNTNYPLLTGTVYKVTVASEPGVIILTSDGLFYAGGPQGIFNESITGSTWGFQKLTIDGKEDGLPYGVKPEDVRMLFASTRLVMITTCDGYVYVIANDYTGFGYVRGNGGGGVSTKWYQVMEDAQTPLKNVIVSRGSSKFAFALKSDGTLWTWGFNTLLGDGTSPQNRSYATQMTLPAGMTKVKMIQATTRLTDNASDWKSSYYILGTDKKVYGLGDNLSGQLGDRSAINRNVWVNAKNPNNSVITDAAWISANEHMNAHDGFAVIRAGGKLYTAGSNYWDMLGRSVIGGVNYLDTPSGIGGSDVIKHCEVGGNTSLVVKEGSTTYGYIGNRSWASMGDGTMGTSNIYYSSFNYTNKPPVNLCTTQCVEPTVTTNSPICKGHTAVFTITGKPGDIVSYQLNGGTTQTVTIGTSGTALVSIPGVSSDQSITLVYVDGGKECFSVLSTAATITVTSNIIPEFNISPTICSDELPFVLPPTSNNATPIAGEWFPHEITESGSYLFQPFDGGECIKPYKIDIKVEESITPVFSFPTVICKGQPFPSLPTSPDNYSYTGHWEHNGTPTGVVTEPGEYTFSFDTINGQCIHDATVVISIVDQPLTPTFYGLSSPMILCLNQTPPLLPIASVEGAMGTWEPSEINTSEEGTKEYCFTPFKGNCTVEKVCFEVTVAESLTPVFSFPTIICTGENYPELPPVSDNEIAGSWDNGGIITGPGIYTFTPNSTAPCVNPVSISVVEEMITPFFDIPQTLCVGSVYTLPDFSDDFPAVPGTWSPSAIVDTTTEGTYTFTFTPLKGNCAKEVTVEITIEACCEGVCPMPNIHCFGFDPTNNPANVNENFAFVDFSAGSVPSAGITFDWYFRFKDYNILQLSGQNPTFDVYCPDNPVMAFGLIVSNGVSIHKYYAPSYSSAVPSYNIPGFGSAPAMTCFIHPVCSEGDTSYRISESITITVYPNPTKSTVRFLGDKLDKYKVSFYDLLGNEIIKNSSLKNEINMERLSSGVYFYRITGDNNFVQTGKIIKE